MTEDEVYPVRGRQTEDRVYPARGRQTEDRVYPARVHLYRTAGP